MQRTILQLSSIIFLIILAACTLPPKPPIYNPDATAKAATALNYFQHGATDLALENLYLASLEDPNNTYVLGSYGYLYEKMERLSDAETYYRHAIQANPGSGLAQNNYGAFLCRQGLFKQAIPYFISAHQIDNDIGTTLTFRNAVSCTEKIKTILGDSQAYAYYTRLITISFAER